MSTRLSGKLVVVISLLSAFASGCRTSEYADITSVLDSQQAAWNVGDIDGFMKGYWKSDDLVFSTPDGDTHGWQATLDRYKSRYATPEQMGKLSFSRLTVARPTPDTAEVSGVYRLDLSEGVKSGRFYLHMRLIDGQWVIVRDRTVADANTPN